jgi:hypothetical protein
MLRESEKKGGNPPYISPAKRSAKDQAELAERIKLARESKPKRSWDELAEAEGIPKRSLQYFYRSYRDRNEVSSPRPYQPGDLQREVAKVLLRGLAKKTTDAARDKG